MVNCFAAGCQHTSESHPCSYFRFPKETHADYKTWVSMCRRADPKDPNKVLNPSPSSRLCSCHFRKGLKSNGPPSIFERNANKVMNHPSPEKRKRRKSLPTPRKEEAALPHQDENPGASSAAMARSDAVDPKQLQFENVMMSAEVMNLRSQIDELTKQLQYTSMRLSYSHVKSSEKLLCHYTGLPASSHFDALHRLCTRFEISYIKGWNVTCLTTEDQLLLTLMKLRLNLSFIDLGDRFNVSEPTVANVFHTWLYVLNEILVLDFMTIPSLKKNQACLPGCFAEFSNCRIILDCTEFQVANARDNMNTQKQTYSNYKSRNTFKALVGVAPNGVITFVSDLYPGSKSDKEIVADSGVLKELHAGDLVLADKGFLIQDLMPQGVSLNLPPFLTNGVFTKQESVFTIKIARARIHVERAIGRIKRYAVLDFIPSHMRCYASMMFKVCAALVNLQNPLISEVSGQYEGGEDAN